MAALAPFNPLPTVNAPGSFNTTSAGFIQGCAIDDPVARFRMRGGTLSTAATLPMYGGCGISDVVPGGTGQPNAVLGPVVSLATKVGPATSGQQAAGLLSGFSVFDQNMAMIMSPQSPVPLAASGMQVNYYPLGSKARIPLAIDPALVDLEGYFTGSLVTWDFVNQRLIPYVAAYSQDVITGASWNSTTGLVTLTLTTGGELAVGDDFTVSGIVSTGAGANVPNGYNGSFTAAAGTTSTTLTYQGAAGSANNPGTYSSGGLLNPGGGAIGRGVTGGGILPISILEVQVGNSMTVSYSPTTGFYTWNRSGSVAIAQI